MKRYLLALLCAILSFGAMAQNAKNVLEIYESSFRPVQTDVLTGVAIDKIGLDQSRRPCARIKMHVNRMTRDEIAQLEVRLPSGNVQLVKKVVAHEGNGLVFEVTAKEKTRFYLHHDKYGDSNEVSVDLEANKEYRIDAQLNLVLPIAVSTNFVGAEVYVDDVYMGVTGADFMLAVQDVVPGEHKIAVVYGAARSEQVVDVNINHFSFRIDVNTVTSRPQYVVFEVEPKNAIVMINNTPQNTVDGCATAVLQNGTYTYRVMANGYHEQTGRFTVSGEKVKKVVKLKADGAMVTLTTDATSEIWVNNEKKGVGSWSGMLISGTYIFEARKAGHSPTVLSQTISSESANQSYTLDAPKPVRGSVDITSSPAMAVVKIDGQQVGETPMVADLLVGNHSVEVLRSGYAPWSANVTVTEGQTATLVATLSKDGSSSEATEYVNAAQNSSSSNNSVNSGSSEMDESKMTPEQLAIKDAIKLFREKEYIRSLSLFRKAAEQGNSEAWRYLGYHYRYGRGVTQDYKNAVKCFRVGADMGNASCQYNLSMLYRDGKGVVKNMAQSIAWLRKSVEQDYDYAQSEMGRRYAYGEGVKMDPKKAFEWWMKAADQDLRTAQYRVGKCYFDGFGIAQDLTQAVEWWMKAAQKGSMNAQYRLGICYKNGYGVKKNHSEAKYWLSKAAEQGHNGAKNELSNY